MRSTVAENLMLKARIAALEAAAEARAKEDSDARLAAEAARSAAEARAKVDSEARMAAEAARSAAEARAAAQALAAEEHASSASASSAGETESQPPLYTFWCLLQRLRAPHM